MLQDSLSAFLLSDLHLLDAHLSLLPRPVGALCSRNRCCPQGLHPDTHQGHIPFLCPGPNPCWGHYRRPPSSHTRHRLQKCLNANFLFLNRHIKIENGQNLGLQMCAHLLQLCSDTLMYKSGQNLVVKLRRNLLSDVYVVWHVHFLSWRKKCPMHLGLKLILKCIWGN